MKGKHKIIFLIGFMGSGKTTLGKKLAKKLNLPFMDSDSEIEKRTGKTISDLFSEFGEDHFRQIEERFILNIEEDFQGVIAVGGGLPCFRNNLEILKQLGRVVYLKRTPKELLHRLINAKKERPLIADKSPDELLDFINMMYEKRSQFYEQADLILYREHQKVDSIMKLLSVSDSENQNTAK